MSTLRQPLSDDLRKIGVTEADVNEYEHEVIVIHPGEYIRDELDELGMSANRLARELHVSPNRITAILNGQRGITADTALRLARWMGTTPDIWMNLQKRYELRLAELEAGQRIIDEVKPRAAD